MTLRKFRKIALPEEHGSWGFVLEPLILSLLIAFSIQGLYIAAAAFFVFLSYQPLKILLNAKINKALKKNAGVILSVYILVSIAFFAAALKESASSAFFPFVIAFVFMGVYLFSDELGRAKTLLSGILAPAGFSFISLTILLVSGWKLSLVLGFYLLLLNRIVPTVFFVHERMKLSRKTKPDILKVALIGAAGILIIAASIQLNILPVYSAAAAAVLFVRSIIGLMPGMEKLNVTKVGILEFIYGAAYVAINYYAYSSWLGFKP